MAITENFAGLSNNADLSTLSAWDKVWFGSAQAGQISGDNRAGNIGIDYTSYGWNGSGHTAVAYRRNDGTFPDDQYAQIGRISGTNNIGPGVRINDPGASNDGDGYYGEYGAGLVGTRKTVGGTTTRLDNYNLQTTNFPATVKIEATGSVIDVYVGGVLNHTNTDAGGPASGNPGVVAFGSTSGNPECDDFECSDLAGGSTVTGTATLTYGHTLTATGTVTSTSSATLSLLATMI